MGQEKSIPELRSRVSALVEEEARLLTQAFELSRDPENRRGVDALFAQVQAIQVERNSLRKELGSALGTHRMHVAAEVWQPGVYEYRQEIGAPAQRVRVVAGPLGLQVRMPGRPEPVRIETLEGSFDGPLAADDQHDEALAATKPAARPRSRRKTG